jgi:hypothetical protein
MTGVPEPVAHVQEWALWLAAVVAGLTALGWLWVRGRRLYVRARAGVRGWVARFDALDALVSHELQPNTGTSMKDSLRRLEETQADHIALAAATHEVIEERLGRLEAVTSTFSESQAHLWPAIEAVAQATPPSKESNE